MNIAVSFRILCFVIKFYMVVVILQLLVVLYIALIILREVINLNCTNVIVLLMSLASSSLLFGADSKLSGTEAADQAQCAAPD